MERRLTLVVGSGALVPHVVAAASKAAGSLQILGFGSQGLGPRMIPVRAGDPEDFFEKVASFRTTHLAFAGAVRLADAEREAWARLAGMPAQTLGDTSLSNVLATIGRDRGLSFVGAHEIAPDLLAAEGHVAGPLVDAALREQAGFALARCREAGRLDLGQALVFSGHRLVAAEDIAGTDALLRRVRRYREQGLTGDGGGRLILAKASKPEQPAFVDLPAIGPKTVANCALAGISLIVVEAGRTLLLNRAALAATADEKGVTVLALSDG
ncbi:MAG: UDP-2,3-diacylglucosamine diphosphatase LpxI [Devosia sp.]